MWSNKAHVAIQGLAGGCTQCPSSGLQSSSAEAVPGWQEDLCLCAEDSQGVLRFVSGAVLFPQRWSLLEKMGAPLF